MSQSKLPRGNGKLAALRNVRAFLENRVDLLEHMWETYGDHARFQLGLFDVYMINDPELIKHVLMNHTKFVKTPATKFLRHVIGDGLLISEGDLHKRQRRMMQPAFTPAHIESYCETMTGAAEEVMARWKDGCELDMHLEMTLLTLNVATRTLFGADLGDLALRVRDAVNAIIPMVENIARPSGALRMLLPTKTNRAFKAALREIDDVVFAIIEERRRSGEVKDDLLSRLLAARDSEGDGSAMTDSQLRNEAVTLLIAGHETTAVALTWTWYALSQHSEVFEKLRGELNRVLGGKTPTAEDLPKLTYTRQVLSESLRLYPPAYFFDRFTTEPWDTGHYVIPKGKYIFLSPYLMHRHPRYWPEPERFNPERWGADADPDRPKFAYFPFGGGARICIGEYFAWEEMVLVLATLAQHFSAELVPGQKVGFDPLISLRPTTMRMRVSERKQVAPVT